MAYYEVSLQTVRFLPKYGTVYFVLANVTVYDLSRLLGSVLCIFGHAKRRVKPISHAFLSVSRKQKGDSLNKFYIVRNRD